ncbi:DNA uptake protein [Pseudanabaena sp. UWO311]|uniref:ComEA family DNA-binding protein n=1 Tax=Pseudanabaena sp. UWO311 TaxID=2487337 RepID=UPI00115B8FB0|nr:helix-hairpin-helix domain-containing protein [Pseudanabaena sp. UWO311]TYQ25202.1 DNA uptake protein [Pseudanabaena sp. UWO311]
MKPIFFYAPLILSGLVFCLVTGCSGTSTPEAAKSGANTTPASPTAVTPTASKSSKIDINTAPIAELDKLELPGTKPSLSERIQGGRPYKQIDDLVTKKVISVEEFKLIQNLVTTETTK